MNKSDVEKGLTLTVILLLIGVACAPSIHANISKESELVEITTEICGINEANSHIVKLTQEQVKEIDTLFESIKSRLDSAKTREETVSIFNNAVVELYNFGLLPDNMSIEESQRLVAGENYHSKLIRNVERLFNKKQNYSSLPEEINVLCLTASKATNLDFLKLPRKGHIRIGLFFQYLGNIAYVLTQFFKDCGRVLIWKGLENITWVLFYLALIFFSYTPFDPAFAMQLCRGVTFGYRQKNVLDEESIYYPCNGWVWTFGLNGIKKWNGSLIGRVWTGGYALWSGLISKAYYIGASGFTGIKIHFSEEQFLLGSVLIVKIETL